MVMVYEKYDASYSTMLINLTVMKRNLVRLPQHPKLTTQLILAVLPFIIIDAEFEICPQRNLQTVICSMINQTNRANFFMTVSKINLPSHAPE
jgi:hypothetical protein